MDMVINGGRNQILDEFRHYISLRNFKEILNTKSGCTVYSLMPQNVTLHCQLYFTITTQ